MVRPALPSLRALQALEATARLGGVTPAARELSVTQPAVSQQLRRLEDELGLALVDRDAAGFALTPVATAYAERLTRAFADIRAATGELRPAGDGERVVSVVVLATLAQRWLIPRLAGFQEAAPDIEVRLVTTSRLEDLARADVDLAIRMGHVGAGDGRADPLIDNQAFPVASPALLARRPLGLPRDLAAHVWIRVTAPPRDEDWPRWLRLAGTPGLAPRAWLDFASSAQALEAAVAGLGIAVAHTPFVVDALAEGRLVAPLAIHLDENGPCHLVTTPGRAARAGVVHFRDWLLTRAALDGTMQTGCPVLSFGRAVEPDRRMPK